MKYRVVSSEKKLKAKGNKRLSKLLELSKEREEKWMAPDSRIELIQALIPLGLKAVEEMLQEEVANIAGERYQHHGGDLKRWGSNPGSVYVGGQKLGVSVPRVRDTKRNKEMTLESYQQLQSSKPINEAVFNQVINGITTRKYEKASTLIPETFGIKKSAVSKRFIEASSHSLSQLTQRNLSLFDVVAIFIDGKCFADNEIIIALGVTMTGEKIILGFVESATENHAVCKGFISDLINRGLKTDNEILFIIDGAKGLRKGIKDALGDKAIVQRCQWHKRENIVSYLPEKQKDGFRKKIDRAYRMPSEEQALKEIKRIGSELKLINESAFSSLLEGLDDTLTVNRLKVTERLRLSLRTTNPIENINSLVGQYTDRVDHWKNSNQRQRWVASAIIEIEPNLQRIRGYKDLTKLRENMRDHKRLLFEKKAA